MAQVIASARRQLCRKQSNGVPVLRVGIMRGNPFLVTQDFDAGAKNPVLRGVAPAMAQRLASTLQAELEVVSYPNPALLVQDAKEDAWDVAFVGLDKARENLVRFSKAYAGTACTYLVRESADVDNASQVDRPGARIAAFEGSVYWLSLLESLKHAELIACPSIPASFDLFQTDPSILAVAGLSPQLAAQVEHQKGKFSDCRLTKGSFTKVRQAIGVPRDNQEDCFSESVAFLDDFIDQMKQSKFLLGICKKYGVESSLEIL